MQRHRSSCCCRVGPSGKQGEVRSSDRTRGRLRPPCLTGVHGPWAGAELRSPEPPHLLEGTSKQLVNPFHFCFLTSKFGHQSFKVNFPKGHRHTVDSVHASQPRVSVRLVQTSVVMFRPLWEAHVSHARLVAVHSLWAWLGSLYVPFFSSHSLAFCSTWPRQGELPEDGWLFFRTAALFTGKGPSASLVSQLEMGEFSRVRCRNTGDC